jgi:molybdenum cofactor cytidylyltransferase
MSQPPAIAGLILAAGASERMGFDKALANHHGRSFLETIITRLREASLERLAVVLGHHADQIQQAVDLSGVQVVVNREYHLGQTSSLRAGLRALESQNLDAIVLCLVDHPTVASSTIRQLIHGYLESRSAVVVPTFKGRRGHPVILTRELFDSLAALPPGRGANSVVRQYSAQTLAVAVDDPGVVLDINDPQMLAQLG